MSEEKFLRDFEDVARRLKAEAMEDRPEFSAALHQRIVAAIPMYARPAPRAKSQGLLRRWLSLAAAAACVAAWLSLLGRGIDADRTARREVPLAETQTSTPVDLADMAGLPGKWSGELPSLMDVAMTSQQWAYLDHDAKVAMQALADRLPMDLGE